MSEQQYAHELPIQRAYIRREAHRDSLAVYLAAAVDSRHSHIIMPFPPATIKTYPVGDRIEEDAAFRLDFGSAQRLLDALWEAGLRPSTGEKAIERAELEAVKAHLADMRKLVFERSAVESVFTLNVEEAIERYKDKVGA